MSKIASFCFFVLIAGLISAQNVGIGVNDPDGKLEIFSNSLDSYPTLLLSESGNDYARISLTNTNSTNYWQIRGYVASNVQNDILSFTNADGGTILSLKGNGRLGLGVGISPKTDFHVANEKRVLFGTDTLGAGDKLMFLPDLHAFRVGALSSGAASTYWNRDSIGIYSFASGRNTRAQGHGATAMGEETEGFGARSFASGYFTNADGNYSTAMGFNTDAFGIGATALGYSSDAESAYTFAVGHTAEARAIYSISIGNRTISDAYGSVSLGSYNEGGGSATAWVDSDPILEVGIGESTGTRENGLTILKDGRHGIMNSQPKANLHVASDGVIGAGTIVAVLESSVSDRPILQFSETPIGNADSGMSIEYDGSGSGSTNKMHINKSTGLPLITFTNGGNVGIGEISPTFSLHLKNSSSTGVARAHSWTTYSDQRIKTDVLTLSHGLQSLMLLRPVAYKQHNSTFEDEQLMVEDEYDETVGLIAQEVYEVIPEAVKKPMNEAEELWGMDYEKLIPVLIKGMQEQQEQIEELKKQVEMLKALNQLEEE